ncbi:hypothetical protein HMPREF0083_02777 [Aneurinibacillus aneurinilyticus ATCC 12856]|jgi:hypothetical protein|uniref:Uncharacterized protein n=1 Tax=Aneurinibacillus aneurinilyticus ATCC 12856 TaxID=649747 RepID=U1YAG0_ANEAE|nr:hypothetical protein HMPREF0083_02777 [Aneurinibacillus aneurinilyticus ATCC 12856]
MPPLVLNKKYFVILLLFPAMKGNKKKLAKNKKTAINKCPYSNLSNAIDTKKAGNPRFLLSA